VHHHGRHHRHHHQHSQPFDWFADESDSSQLSSLQCFALLADATSFIWLLHRFLYQLESLKGQMIEFSLCRPKYTGSGPAPILRFIDKTHSMLPNRRLKRIIIGLHID
jgi:hypothetical protein